MLLGGILPPSAAVADDGIQTSDLKKLLGLDCDLEAPNPKLKKDKNFKPTRAYSFENPAEALRDTPAPTELDLAEVGNDPSPFKRGAKRGIRGQAFASYNRYLARITEENEKAPEGKRKEAWGWVRWLNTFIPAQANDGKGAAYVRLFLKECGLAENSDWKQQQTPLASRCGHVIIHAAALLGSH